MKDTKILRGDLNSNIDFIEFTEDSLEMCDISVRDVHCYFANNVLTHNCSEELNIASNLSGETVISDAINEGSDLHMAIAKFAFGIEDEAIRDKVKTLNFGVLYGMDKYTLAKRMKVVVDVASSMMITYFSKLSRLDRWRKYVIDTARRKGMIFTFFGRPRLLYRYYASSSYQDHAFADRSAVNSSIQGPCIGNSRILLENGLFTIDSVVDSYLKLGLPLSVKHPLFKVWNGEKFCNFGVVDAGLRNCKKVILKNGSTIVLGKDHKIKIVTDLGFQFKDIADLRVGDRVVCSLPKSVEFFSSSIASDSEMYLLGRYLGDGSLYNNYIVVSCSLEEVESTISYFEDLGFEPYDKELDIKMSNYTVDKRLFYQPWLDKGYKFNIYDNRRGDAARFKVRVSKKDLIDRDLIEGHAAKGKRIPNSVFNASLKQRSIFIRGFFDSDGSKTQSSFDWHMCQRSILEDLQLLLRTCGIRSNIYDCNDGTFKLTVVESEKFANFIGIADKTRTFKKYGRIQDSVMTPRFLEEQFLNWYESNVNNGYWKRIGLTEDQWKRDRALVSKIRKNKGCGISTFYDVCKSLGFPINDNYYYSEVKLIEDYGIYKTYCLSLWDESHQYEANGMIHHNCIPINSMVELNNKAVKLSDILLKKVIIADGRSAIGSRRGDGVYTLTMTKSGDFIVADKDHGLLYGDINKPNYRRISQGLDIPVLTSPLGKKSISFKALFSLLFSKGKLKNKLITKLKSLSVASSVSYDLVISTNLFLSFVSNLRIHFNDPITASNLRTVASLHGFNMIAVGKNVDNNEYKFVWKRSKKVKPIWTKEIGKGPIGSMTLTSGYQYYQSQGFQNKNTGGDVIRILLTSLFKQQYIDPEFRDNFIIGFPVHDEVDCYVKKDYLFKGYYLLKKMMVLRPSNWKSPLKCEIGIGRTWGDCLDVVGVTRDNKLIVAGLNDKEELPKLNLDVRGLPHDTPEERDKENLRILSENNGTDEYELRKIGLLK